MLKFVYHEFREQKDGFREAQVALLIYRATAFPCYASAIAKLAKLI